MFNWTQSKQQTLETKLRRARCQAKCQHIDHKIAHPSEAREAGKETSSYTELTIRVNKQVKDAQDLAMSRRLKHVI